MQYGRERGRGERSHEQTYRHGKYRRPARHPKHIPDDAVGIIQEGVHILARGLVDEGVDGVDHGIGVSDGPRRQVHGPALQVDVGRAVRRHELVELDAEIDDADLDLPQAYGARGRRRPQLLDVEVSIARPDHGMRAVEGHIVETGADEKALGDPVPEARQPAHAGRLYLTRHAGPRRVERVGDTLFAWAVSTPRWRQVAQPLSPIHVEIISHLLLPCCAASCIARKRSAVASGWSRASSRAGTSTSSS